MNRSYEYLVHGKYHYVTELALGNDENVPFDHICSKCTISCYEGVGYYTFPLDHSVLVRSDILTLRFPWGHVGLRVAYMITVDITCSG